MSRRLWLSVAALVFVIGLQAQTPQAGAQGRASFEVATVKPSDPKDPSGGWFMEGRQFRIRNRSVTSMIMFGYGVHPQQIVDAPAWMSEHYDIVGTADAPEAVGGPQFREMLQRLLEDRFGLKLRRESRPMTAYVITVAKRGPRLRPSKGDPNGTGDQDASSSPRGETVRMVNVSMPEFAGLMQFFLDRPVVQGTDLLGKYDFELSWKPGMSQSGPDDFPDLVTAAREQLGLNISVEKTPVDVLVVEHAERPSAN